MVSSNEIYRKAMREKLKKMAGQGYSKEERENFMKLLARRQAGATQRAKSTLSKRGMLDSSIQENVMQDIEKKGTDAATAFEAQSKAIQRENFWKSFQGTMSINQQGYQEEMGAWQRQMGEKKFDLQKEMAKWQKEQAKWERDFRENRFKWEKRQQEAARGDKMWDSFASLVMTMALL